MVGGPGRFDTCLGKLSSRVVSKAGADAYRLGLMRGYCTQQSGIGIATTYGRDSCGRAACVGLEILVVGLLFPSFTTLEDFGPEFLLTTGASTRWPGSSLLYFAILMRFRLLKSPIGHHICRTFRISQWRKRLPPWTN
jgi:hypothetical protein